MAGFITARHVFGHPVLIVREFGWPVFLRALVAVVSPRPTTFLQCVWGR